MKVLVVLVPIRSEESWKLAWQLCPPNEKTDFALGLDTQTNTPCADGRLRNFEMNLKQKLIQLVKNAGIATACLAVVPIVDAQTQSQPNRNLRVPQQAAQAIEAAPRLLSAPANAPKVQVPSQSTVRRPQVSPRAQQQGFVPKHQRNQRVQLANYPAKSQVFGESVLGSCATGDCATGNCSSCNAGSSTGELVIDQGYEMGCGVSDGCGIDGEIVPYGYGGGADSTNPCGYQRYPALISLSDMEYFGGVQGVKGAVNLGQAGSFGFNEGVNWGFPIPSFGGLGLSGQVGVRFIQANPNGAQFTQSSREQIFVTGGIFRRVDYGLQIGAAYDFLNEDWYFKGTFGQIRGEISWVGSYGNTMGFRYTVETEEEPRVGAVATPLVPTAGPFNTFTPHDTYRFFYEQKFAQSNALVNAWGGFTGDSQGLIGADARLPVTERFMFHATATHLIDGNSGNFSNIEEAWNIGINLVFIPKGWSRWKRAYHRPMFDVADNGSFLIGRN